MFPPGKAVSPKDRGRRFSLVPRFSTLVTLSNSLLPLSVLFFSVLITAVIVTWAATSGSTTFVESGGSKQAAEAREAVTPFLSDVMPETPGRVKVKLSREESELAKAESVYKHNIIRRWEMMGGALPPYPYKQWKAGRIREVFLKPTYACPHPSRVGSRERGKWLCNVHKLKGKETTIYSVGALEDLSFEKQVAADWGPETKVHAFSPFLSKREQRKLTEPGTETSKALSSFHALGLCPADSCVQMQKESPGKEFLTFEQVMGKMEDKHVDILKLDCEGCETNVIYEIGQTFKRDEPPFDQIIVELHQARVPTKTLPVIFTLEGLGFRLFHVERERTSSQRYELSFVHEAFLFQNKTSSVQIYKDGQ